MLGSQSINSTKINSSKKNGSSSNRINSAPKKYKSPYNNSSYRNVYGNGGTRQSITSQSSQNYNGNLNKNDYETVLKVNEGDDFYVNIKEPKKSFRNSIGKHSKSYFGRGREVNNPRNSNQRFHSNFRKGSGERRKFKPKKTTFGQNQNDNMIHINSIAKKLNSSHKRESALFKLKRKNSKNVDLVNLDLGGRRISPKNYQNHQNFRGKWGMKNSKIIYKIN